MPALSELGLKDRIHITKQGHPQKGLKKTNIAPKISFSFYLDLVKFVYPDFQGTDGALYFITKGYTVSGNQGTHDKPNEIQKNNIKQNRIKTSLRWDPD